MRRCNLTFNSILCGGSQLGVLQQKLQLHSAYAPEHVHQVSLNCIQCMDVLVESPRQGGVLCSGKSIEVVQLFVRHPQRLVAAARKQSV